MNRNQGNTNEVEKNRIRSEINAQVEEFLRSGGRIDVLKSNQNKTNASIGSVWHGPDEVSGISLHVFDPAIRGKTDRFIVVFEKR